MASSVPKDLNTFVKYMEKLDTKFRQRLSADLLSYIKEPSNPIICQNTWHLIENLIKWMENSNYKVSSNAIEIMTYLVDRLGDDFRPYRHRVLCVAIENLGDAKKIVREKAQLLLKMLGRDVLKPQHLLEKLKPNFTHNNDYMREEVLRCLVNTLNEHGAQKVEPWKFVPNVVNLLSDRTATVRALAFSTLVDIYKHIGDKLRIHIYLEPAAARLPDLLAKFDEVKNAGELLPTASTSADSRPKELPTRRRRSRSLGLSSSQLLDRFGQPIAPVRYPPMCPAMHGRLPALDRFGQPIVPVRYPPMCPTLHRRLPDLDRFGQPTVPERYPTMCPTRLGIPLTNVRSRSR